MFLRLATRAAAAPRAAALRQTRLALATRGYADLGHPHTGPAGAPRSPADAPRDAPPGTPRGPPPRKDDNSTLLMAGGAIALAGVAYYVLTSDKKDAKGSAKELEGRAKGKAHELTGELKRGYDETVGEAKRAFK